MENQTVTIPFLYFKELLEKATQRDTVYAMVIKDKWIQRNEILEMLGVTAKDEEEDEYCQSFMNCLQDTKILNIF